MRQLKSMLKEPFIHFMILGLILYVSLTTPGNSSGAEKITINDADIDRVKAIYQKQFGVLPSRTQLEKLIENQVREEIFWREGIAMGLDRNDEIVRRRIAQKFEFLQQDMITPEPPTTQQLEAYFQNHVAQYAIPPRVSFSHIFIATEGAGGKKNPRLQQVQHQLETVGNMHFETLGDEFPGQSNIVTLDRNELARIFGKSEIIDSAFHAPLNQWSGPYNSGYGSHFIFVSSRSEEKIPPLNSMRERVVADYLENQRQQLNRTAYARLLEKYNVSVESTL